MLAIPSQSIGYIIVAERLRAVMSDNIFMVKCRELLRNKKVPRLLASNVWRTHELGCYS